MLFPVPNIKIIGPLTEGENDTLHFEDEGSDKTAELYQTWNGTVVARVDEPGQEPQYFTYRTEPQG